MFKYFFLEILKTGDIEGECGKLDHCSHSFCFRCIKDWADVSNECPCCKTRFYELLHYQPGGMELIEKVKIKYKNLVYEENIEDLIDPSNR
jgi:hypothetical protein